MFIRWKFESPEQEGSFTFRVSNDPGSPIRAVAQGGQSLKGRP